jgi:hypothetical protein
MFKNLVNTIKLSAHSFDIRLVVLVLMLVLFLLGAGAPSASGI